MHDNVIFGAYGFDLYSGTRYLIHADAVILASGGHNRIWRRTSSRRDENTGDSFRLAVLAGGRIRDPELVQFHPSGILDPESAAAAEYSAHLQAQQRSAAALSEARNEVDELLAGRGPENVRSLQRAIRNTMTEHAGVVRDEAGLLAGLAELEALEREAVPPIPSEIAALMRDVSTAGKLLE